MHAKSGLRVVLEWKIYRPDSVIADVIPFESVLVGRVTMLLSIHDLSRLKGFTLSAIQPARCRRQ